MRCEEREEGERKFFSRWNNFRRERDRGKRGREGREENKIGRRSLGEKERMGRKGGEDAERTNAISRACAREIEFERQRNSEGESRKVKKRER